MNSFSVYKSDNYNDVYSVVRKHFEAHNIMAEISADTHVLIKPNLVTDKDAAFSVTTNPDFVYSVARYLCENGIKKITVADCPGGALLLFSQMSDVFERCGFSPLSEIAILNTDFESSDIPCPEGFSNKKFNIINAVANADYVINVPKLKTHNQTGITAGVKNIFGCIPGLQKPEFHAKYPKSEDFSNMLVELAATVKPDFTIVDAIEIMEGNGPTNGKKRHLGLTFAGKNIFGLDKFIADYLDIPPDSITTISAAEEKGWNPKEYSVIGEKDFSLTEPILLPEYIRASSFGGKIHAKIKTLFTRVNDSLFMSYPLMNKKCTQCCKCVLTCPQKALTNKEKKITLDIEKCIGCLCCDEVCPNAAVDIKRKFKKRKTRK